MCPPQVGTEEGSPPRKTRVLWEENGDGYRVGQKAKFPGTGLPCLVPLYLSRAAGLATALFRGGGALGPDLDSVPAGIEFVVAQLKSMVLALGLMDLRLTVEQAVLLSRLEEEYQVRAASAQKRGPGAD